MTRSVRIHAFGDADVLRIEDIVTGKPGAGEVRLRVHAIGLNRAEVTLRSGRSPVKPSLPSSIGLEAAGVIEMLGPDVSGFAVGDRVALVPAYYAAQYALYGEVSLAPARSLVAIPDHVSFSEAAATWMAYGTAWGGLIAIGKLAAGQTVLIPAASSSVGLAAIQIANRLHARPIALTRKADALRGHGAAEVVATAEQDVVAEVKRLTDDKGAHLVFDPVGGSAFPQLAHAMTMRLGRPRSPMRTGVKSGWTDITGS
jgi:NADPH:quinone reductase-like Zn-dependent oxidoreductase